MPLYSSYSNADAISSIRRTVLFSLKSGSGSSQIWVAKSGQVRLWPDFETVKSGTTLTQTVLCVLLSEYRGTIRSPCQLNLTVLRQVYLVTNWPLRLQYHITRKWQLPWLFRVVATIVKLTFKRSPSPSNPKNFMQPADWHFFPMHLTISRILMSLKSMVHTRGMNLNTQVAACNEQSWVNLALDLYTEATITSVYNMNHTRM